MARYIGQLGTDVYGISLDEQRVGHLQVTAAEAVVADTDGVLAAHTCDGSPEVKTTGITNPPYPRSITATAGGTAGDIKAIQVVVVGTNMADKVITETLPAFTVNTAGTVEGNLAFKTVTSITIPAHDNTGATTSVGFGDKLGLPFMLDKNTVLTATLAGVRETTFPAVVFDDDELEKNTIDLHSALNGTVVDIYLSL